MAKKIAFRYRIYCFALLMSFLTSMIVCAAVISLHTSSLEGFIHIWPSSFAIAWPIVFVAILIIAPLVNNLLNLFIEPN